MFGYIMFPKMSISGILEKFYTGLDENNLEDTPPYIPTHRYSYWDNVVVTYLDGFSKIDGHGIGSPYVIWFPVV